MKILTGDEIIPTFHNDYYKAGGKLASNQSLNYDDFANKK
ncbi:10192_t:CDS:2 [Funneliformis caledonium]|uniref:10192_t:CDS:1 n=1 Tax=Funneliformis caledonium TaxID=1117310 RepID=A0A9N8ZS02_9GLOM|nr:10192_t:CDS:2 [Funneliformis caledonium]